jgi:hypothetical protein
MQELCMENGAVPDIIFLQETNVHSGVFHRLEGLETGWAAAFNSKLVGRMKGTGILIRQSKLLGPKTTIQPVYEDSNDIFDIIAVKVRSLMLVSVYVHVLRDQGAREVLDELLNVLLHKITGDHDGPIIVGGDFNLRHDVDLLVESMSALELLPVYPDGGEAQPTHDRGGVLDWIFIQRPVTASPLQIIQRGADHAILRSTMTLALNPEARSTDVRYKWKNLSKLDEDRRREMTVEMEQAGREAQDITQFRDRIQQILLKYLGRAKSRPGSLPKHWLDDGVRQARAAYRQANTEYQRLHTPENKQEMTRARNRYFSAMRRRKRRARAELARKVDTGEISIHHLVNASKKDPRHQERLVPDLEKMLAFWTGLFSHPDPLDQDDIWDYLSGEAERPAAFPEIVFTLDELKEALQKTDKNKAPGDDDIRPVLFQDASDQLLGNIARLLTQMANDEGPLPSWMKEGLAKTLYKKGRKDDPSNYRVIIMNSIFAKLYEKMLEIRGQKMVEEEVLKISVEQGGFMPRRSTLDSIFILESLRDSQIKHCKTMYAAFLDLRKAFDSVSHKKFLQLMRERGAPEDWVVQLSKMLAGRRMKLFDALINLEVGTAQGSPISPLLFILFMNPLIERLRTCRGVQFAAQAFIRSLLFADDICLTVETLEDLAEMLRICEEWAQEFGMSFNSSKSEIIQLAGRIPEVRPEVLLGGEPITWKTEIKYLGVLIMQGRRRRVPLPLARLWGCYHRIKRVLDPRLPLPLKAQILMIGTDVLSVALYPAAVRDLDYAGIDRFVNRILCRITGCPQRWTSATFLRAELGLLPSKYMAHQRALMHLWHLHNEAWFRNHLGDLRGAGPLKRLTNLAALYQLDLSTLRLSSKAAWDKNVKAAVRAAACRDVDVDLLVRTLPEARDEFKAREYLRYAGALGRVGVQYRWSVLQQGYPRMVDEPRSRYMLFGGASLLPVLNGEAEPPLPPATVELRDQVLVAVAEELSGQAFDDGVIPEAIMPHVRDAVENLKWPNQSKAVTGVLLGLLQRVGQQVTRHLRDSDGSQEEG